jgi:hypothetical protein
MSIWDERDGWISDDAMAQWDPNDGWIEEEPDDER